MWSEVDTTDVYGSQKMNNKLLLIVFGFVIEILINLLFLNLFVGVVIETFNQEKDKLSKNDLLSIEQKKWIQVQLMGYQASPVYKQGLTGERLRDAAIKLVQHRMFDLVILGCIVGNTLVLMLKWYAMGEGTEKVITIINYAFLVVFACEAIIKIFALRTRYFYDGWNLFDLLVVLITCIIIGIGFSPRVSAKSLGIQSTILRSLRLGRLLRLLRSMKKLQIVFNTLFEAVPAMASLGALLLLLMFMYAIIGMNVFGFANVGDW
jgi:hypothetical protein